MTIQGTLARIALILLFCIGICACGTSNRSTIQRSKNINNQKQVQMHRAKPLASKTDLDIESYQEIFDLSDYTTEAFAHNLWDEIRDNLQFPDETDRPEVQQQISWFQNNQKYLERMITKSAPFIHYIYQQTKERSMPSELALLPVIESAYNPLAYSKAGATGVWQIMPGTAALLGLKMNWWYDGRRDLSASTKAALNYLAYSNRRFDQDWLLSIASYNCGEGRVGSEINYNKKHELATDVWSLHLPQQTKNYVPKFLAIVAIVKDPVRYGITLPPISSAPYIESVKIDSQIDLHQAAKLADVDIKTIHDLNPGYLRFATDPDGPHELMLPIDKTDIFKQNLQLLPDNEKIIWRDYHARYGDSLASIASKYNTESSVLKKVNNLPNDHIKPKQHLLIPANYHGSTQNPVVKQAAVVAKTHMKQPKNTAHKKKHLYIYKVVRGDTLQSLARRFNSNLKTIIKTNHLKSVNLKPGQIIKILS